MRGAGTADNRAVTRCKSALTGQELGQVEEDPVLVLFDLGRHFEEGEDHGGGLGVGQGGMCSVWVRRAWCRT